MENPEVKEIILKFLNFTDVIYLTPIYDIKFYQDVKLIKGNISKALVDSDYITYY
jgi:hypothetical protein